MPVQPNQQIAHYRIIEKIGEGGMGEVYRATDTQLEREVAIKVLPAAVADDPERLGRFDREAKLLATLNHPAIAGVYGLHEDAGVRFIAMELVPGEDLAQLLKRGPLPHDRAMDLAMQVADALEAAHERGVIHRDLKPANIKITPDDQVKVLDFGLAKAFEADPTTSSASLTMSPTITTAGTVAGVILGTAAYMAPEQARAQTVDKRADIWAFGAVLYEMLTGTMPFSGDTVSDTLASVLKLEPDWNALPAATPGATRRLLRRCLEKNPKKRLRDIGEARILIDEYRDDPEGLTVETGDTSRPRAAAAPRVSSPLPWALAGVLAAAWLLTFWWLQPAAPEAQVAEPAVRLRVPMGPGQELSITGVSSTGAATVPSPNGRLLAYVAREGDSSKLYLRHMDKFEGMPLSGTEGARAPFFSPDGNWIAFFTSRQLKKVSISGGAPLTLTETQENRGGTWSADGTIVFSPNITSGLSRIPDSGGTPEMVTEIKDKERSHRWPHFLPDGKHVLFMTQDMSRTYDDAAVEVVNIDTRERRVLHEGGTYPRWLPTGHLAFVRDGTLFAASFDPQALTVTGAPTPLLEGVLSLADFSSGDGTAHYAFSNNGLLAYVEGTAFDEECTLVWRDRNGEESVLLDEPAVYLEPKLSPDNQRIVTKVDSDAGIDIWVYDIPRDVLTRLTFDPGLSDRPIWTPDGDHIVFTSSKEDAPGIYRVPADGSRPPELILQVTGFADAGSFSPEGHMAIHHQRPGGTWDVEVVRFEDGKALAPEPFVGGEATEVFPRFSPDGKWIAYLSNESGQFEVYVRPYPGPGGKWQISTGGGITPRWTKDGREIVYRNDRQWVAVPLDDDDTTLKVGRPEVILEGDYVLRDVFAAHDVTEDGERLILLKSESGREGLKQAQLNLVFNWFNEVRELAGPAR